MVSRLLASFFTCCGCRSMNSRILRLGYFASLACAVVLAIVSSCDNASDPEPLPSNDNASDPEPLSSNDNASDPKSRTMVVAAKADADSLNPLLTRFQTGSQIVALMFDSLVKTQPDLSPAPRLAREWTFSDDRLKLTMVLRDDVKWHDGHPFTAHDVAFTFSLHENPEAGFPSLKWKQHIVDCRAIDDHTVEYTYDHSYPDQLKDAYVGSTLPKHILGDVPADELKTHSFNANPIGTGKYRFAEWKPNEYVRITAFEGHYEGPPKIENIIFKVVPELENMLLQLRNGDVDVVLRVPAERFGELDALDTVRSYSLPDRLYSFIAWNQNHELFRSARVRRALTLAIPRKKLCEAAYDRHASVCNDPVWPALWAHKPDVEQFDYDPEAAAALLREEGWVDTDGDGTLDKNGDPFRFELMTNRGNKVREDTVTFVQGYLKQIGIDVQLAIVESARFAKTFQSKEFQALMGGWGSALKMDLTGVWHSKSTISNIVSYANPEVDRLCEEAVREFDRTKAKALWWEAIDHIVRDQPYTFLFRPNMINFVSSRISGVRFESHSWFYHIHEWTLDP